METAAGPYVNSALYPPLTFLNRVWGPHGAQHNLSLHRRSSEVTLTIKALLLLKNKPRRQEPAQQCEKTCRNRALMCEIGTDASFGGRKWVRPIKMGFNQSRISKLRPWDETEFFEIRANERSHDGFNLEMESIMGIMMIYFYVFRLCVLRHLIPWNRKHFHRFTSSGAKYSVWQGAANWLANFW